MRRKLALISATVALGALLVVGGTMAYFTGTADKTNTITTYGNGQGLNGDIKVEETVPANPEGYTAVEKEDKSGITYENVKPGMVIGKNPTIKYDGTTKAYIRYTIKVTEADFANLTFYKDGEIVKPMDADGNDKIVGTANIDGTDTVYVYYKTAKENGFIDELFDEVKFNGAAFGNDFSGGEIVVVADAVSAEDFTFNENSTDPWNGQQIESAKAE